MRFNGKLLSTAYILGKHLIPILILVIYSFLGGWIFMSLETPYYSKTDSSNISNGTSSERLPYDRWKILQEKFVNNLTEIVKEYYDKKSRGNLFVAKISSEFSDKVSENQSVTKYESKNKTVNETWIYYNDKGSKETLSLEYVIATLIKEYNAESVKLNNDRNMNAYSRQSAVGENPWNIWDATLYAASLYTTIGYGNIVCYTVGGRVATMIYSMIGIPLVLTILSDLGMLLFRAMKYVHIRLRFLFQRFSRYEFPNDISEISVTSAFLLWIVWMCMSAGIFLIWEDWTYFESLYFFFITLTTIGLGDVTPNHPAYTLGAFALVLFGLSIVSMFITIVQTKVEHLFQSLMKNIDSEYQQKVLDPTQGLMDEEFNSGMGLMKFYKQKPLKERILYKLMDKHKKEMLEDYYRKKSSTKNKNVQTDLKYVRNQELQVDLEADEMAKYKHRKYIYNLDD